MYSFELKSECAARLGNLGLQPAVLASFIDQVTEMYSS